MKNALRVSLVAALCSLAFAQQVTVTPNVGLQIPSYNTSNWQVAMDYDMNLLDRLLAGNTLTLQGFSSAIGGACDTGISRTAPGIIKVGNCTPGDASGSVYAAHYFGDGSGLTGITGSGSMVYPAAGFSVSLGVGAGWGVSVAVPTGSVVGTGQVNSYTAGFTQTFASSSTNPGLSLGGVSSDPTSLSQGNAWFRADLHHLRVHDGTIAQSVMYQSDPVTTTQLPSVVARTDQGATFGAFAYDFSAASKWIPPVASTDPGTCGVGQVYFNTALPGLRGCTSTNTWTTMGGGGGGGGSITINGVTGTTFTFPLLATSGYGTKTVYNSGANTNTVSLFEAGRKVTTTSDAISQTDCNGSIQYNSGSAVAVSVAQTPLTIAQGCVFTATNINAQAVLTPSTSTINGQTSYTLAAASPSAPTSVVFYADNTGNFTILGSSAGGGGGGGGGFTPGTVISMGTLSGVSGNSGTTTFYMTNTATSGHNFAWSNGDATHNPGNLNLFDYTTNVTGFDLNTNSATHPEQRTTSGGVFGWDTDAQYSQVGSLITGLSSTSTGVMELGTGAYGAVDGEMILNKIATGTSSNTDLAGQITLSGGSGTYTFTGGYASTPICVATDASAVNPVKIGTTNTALTITGTGSDVVRYICVARN